MSPWKTDMCIILRADRLRAAFKAHALVLQVSTKKSKFQALYTCIFDLRFSLHSDCVLRYITHPESCYQNINSV